jgi:hypothetical protein
MEREEIGNGEDIAPGRDLVEVIKDVIEDVFLQGIKSQIKEELKCEMCHHTNLDAKNNWCCAPMAEFMRELFYYGKKPEVTVYAFKGNILICCPFCGSKL